MEQNASLSVRALSLSAVKRPFMWLLLALVVLLVGPPFLPDTDGRNPGLDVLVSFVLIAGVAAASTNRRQLLWAIALGLLALGTRWGAFAVGERLGLLALITNLAFVAFIIVTILLAAARERAITADTISGGICVYLLTGVFFALAFRLCEVAAPGSFGFAADATVALRELLYFSFVTLSTLGYGDITPVSPVAQTLSLAEAVFGQLFIAIFIARLVGLYVAAGAERVGSSPTPPAPGDHTSSGSR